ATVERVVARVAVEGVGPAVAVEDIVVGAAVEGVGRRAADQGIVPPLTVGRGRECRLVLEAVVTVPGIEAGRGGSREVSLLLRRTVQSADQSPVGADHDVVIIHTAGDDKLGPTDLERGQELPALHQLEAGFRPMPTHATGFRTGTLGKPLR